MPLSLSFSLYFFLSLSVFADPSVRKLGAATYPPFLKEQQKRQHLHLLQMADN
jgi:hypothetical protein